jgi:hypothetical protein
MLVWNLLGKDQEKAQRDAGHRTLMLVERHTYREELLHFRLKTDTTDDETENCVCL